MYCEHVPDDISDWETRQQWPLIFRFRPHSFAAQDIDELALRYTVALAAVRGALDLRIDSLPPIELFCADLPPEGPPESSAEGAVASADRIVLRIVHSPDAPDTAPEVVLTRALTTYCLGERPRAARFWDEGLGGYLAGRSGFSSHHTEAPTRCRQLLLEGLLPPLEELVGEAGTRVSVLVATVAGGFAAHLIDTSGIERYRSLLQSISPEDAGAFRHIYHRPLVVVDRDWRRRLEASEKSAGQSIWGVLCRLAPLARPYWRDGVVILLYTLLTIAFSAAIPLAFRLLIDNVLGRRPLSEPLPFIGPEGYVIDTPEQQLQVLILLVAALGMLYIVAAVARPRLNALYNRVGESFAIDLRQLTLRVLSSLPSAFFSRTTVADINHRVVQDIATIQQTLTGSLVPLVSGSLSIAMYGTMLVLLQAQLAVVALAGLPLLALVYRGRRRSPRAAALERIRRLADLSARVNEFAAAHVLVKIYLAAPHLLQRLGGRMQTHRALNIVYARESSLLTQIGALLMHFGQLLVLLVGGYLVVTSGGQDLAPGGLVAFYVLFNQLFLPIADVSSASQSLVGASASLDRVTELLAEMPEQEPVDAVQVQPLAGEIRFHDVNFTYAVGKTVLRHLNLAISAGTTVAFVGSTGAGKSSLVQLLPRLYDPTHGAITWDGVDLREASLTSLRQQIAYVPQDSYVISASVYDNIRFGLANTSEEEVERAARLAQAHQFIAGLPDGYDTIVGEHGVGLSGGQRQRIALARALLRRPSVLILDEATSSLDSTTQRAVQDGLLTSGPRTIVKIAHRLETIADADVIFVLDSGRLVEHGRHDELAAAGGVYAQLLRDQVSMLDAAGRPTARQAVRWLARLSPFAELSADRLERLASVLTRLELPAGEMVYQQGGASDDLYILGNGRVEVLERDETGEERVAKTLSTGAVFGASGFLQGRPRLTEARTASNVLLYVLHRSSFEAAVGTGARAPFPNTNAPVVDESSTERVATPVHSHGFTP
ncbi:MAG: ATP-binding cassette domain-containing protein [Chloroflexi bacterium]|nr:ATP-binding cassette domain-containing protein [Chloroflexota bacterium]